MDQQNNSQPNQSDFVDNPNYQQPLANASGPGNSDFVDNPNFGKPAHYDPWSADTGSSFLNAAQDVVSGIGKGVAQTVGGAAHLAANVAHRALGTPNQTPEALQGLEEASKPQGTAENIGSGIESIAEFMMGDEALKGLSMADRLKQVSGIMKYIEKSPKLAKALELGINVGKAGSELSPEERTLLQQHPILARLAGHGLSAIRQGLVQGGQTLVKTGGDVGEAAKSGLTQGIASGVIGTGAGLIGGALEHGANAAKTAEDLAGQAAAGPTETQLNQQLGQKVTGTLQPQIDAAQAVKTEAEERLAGAAQSPATMAANAPEHAAITASAQKAAHSAYAALGDEFEKGREALKAATDGEELTYENSPYQQAAKDLIGEAKENAHPLDEAANKTRPGSGFANDKLQKLIDPYGEAELKEAAKETTVGADGVKTPTPAAQQAQEELDAIAEKKENEPITMTMEDLLDHRKSLNENLRKTGWATDEQRADRDIYHKLIEGVDNSIQQLTEQSGNPEAMGILQKMNADYKTGIARFKNPDVKALLQGSTNDVAKKLMGGGTSVADINTVRDAIGKDAFTKLADSSVQRMAADAIDKATGQFNFKTFFNNWTRIPPQVRAAMFQESLKGGAVENAIMQAQKVNASGAIPGAEATIKDTTKAIQDLMGNGNVKSLLGDPERVQQLAQTVGPEAMGELGTSVLQNQLREAATKSDKIFGNVDTGKVLKFVESLKDSPEVVDALFRPTPERAAAYDKLLKDLQNVQGVKNMLKIGVIAPTLGAAPAALGAVGFMAHSLMATLGSMAAMGGEGYAVAHGLLERIANSPAVWGALKAAGKVAQGPVATGATAVSKVAAGRTANALRQAIMGTGSSLSGGEANFPKTNGSIPTPQSASASINTYEVGPLKGQIVPGLVQQGNIDVNHRPGITNDDGSKSSIYSMTVPLDMP
jgi:hypothetical protein